MENIKRHLPTYFLLALLLHLLLFISFSVRFLFPSLEHPYESSSDSDADKVIPAYVYHEERNNPLPSQMNTSQPTPAMKPQETTKEEKQEQLDKDAIAIKKEKQPEKTERQQMAKEAANPSKQVISDQHETQTMASKKGIDNLLLKLLSQATAAKLVYPKIAEDFRLRGTVKVKFTIAPNGIVSQVSLDETSGSTVLDEAALNTIHAISPVKGVDKYLSQPKVIHAGIIYGTEKSRQFEAMS